MNNDISDADLLKTLETINIPDERCSVRSRFDGLGLREDTLAEHYADIARFRLSTEVPKDVIVQYETAKNIYLYAWYVYRFYPVAEHQVLACLEMGLRKRFPGALPPGYGYKNKPNLRPTLAPLLRYAIDQGHVKNEGFSRWHSLVQQRARHRVMLEQIQELETTDFMTQEIRDETILANAQDLDCDFVSALDEFLPGIRNSYAHGSSRLSSQVLGSFELVNEILTQVYASNASTYSLCKAVILD